MRNLKRVLSLALAVVMVIGMMVMTTSAADLVDADEIKNVEAVAVMNALEVLQGDEDGNFNPANILTREQAAKIICYMLMGADNAEMLTGTSNFTDVAADRWSAPFISYCASLDIISGYNGEFNPTGELTGVAFAKMLLVALGYDAEIEGYMNNDNWATNIATDAIEAGINVKGVDLAAAVSRDNAAQMAFNTLTATMVKYTNKGTTIEIDGVNVVVGASSATAVASVGDNNYDQTIANKGDEYQQFCEKYFENLKKTTGAADDFTRGAKYSWYLDKNENLAFDPATETRIHNEAKTAVITYTEAVTVPVIAKALKGYTFNGTKLIDKDTQIGATTTAIGDLTFGASTDKIAVKLAALTGTGKVVEIYVDSTGAVEDVNVIAYTVETIDNITTNSTSGDVTYDFSVTADKIDYADNSVNADQVKLYGNFSKGDVVTTYAGTNFVHVYPTTEITGAQTAYSDSDETVTVGGTVYTVGTGVTGVTMTNFHTNSKDAANYYLDQFGNVVKTTAINTAYTNFAQIKGNAVYTVTADVDGNTPAFTARFVLADGTVGTYDIKLHKAGPNYYLDKDKTIAITATAAGVQTVASTYLIANDVYAYELDDGAISLQKVATTAAADSIVKGTCDDIDAGDTYVVAGDTAYSKQTLLTSETIYVLYNSTKKTATQYVGALPSGADLDDAGTTIVALGNDDNTLAVAKVVFGVTTDIGAVATKDYAYVVADDCTVELIGNDTYYVYEGLKADGSKITLYNKTSGLGANDVYTWSEDANIYGIYTTGVKAAETYKVVGDQMVGQTTGSVYNMDGANVVFVNKQKTTVNNSVCVVVVEMKGANPTSNAETIFVVG